MIVREDIILRCLIYIIVPSADNRASSANFAFCTLHFAFPRAAVISPKAPSERGLREAVEEIAQR